MESIKNYIEKAEKKAGTQKELARILGITTSYIRNVKADKSGLPTAICMKLADYIEEDQMKVVAASELVTEKDEERRKILKSCFRKVASVAAVAVVTSILTPSSANASQITDSHLQNLYYIKNNRRKRGRRFSDQLNDYLGKLAVFFQHRHFLN